MKYCIEVFVSGNIYQYHGFEILQIDEVYATMEMMMFIQYNGLHVTFLFNNLKT